MFGKQLLDVLFLTMAVHGVNNQRNPTGEQ